jgi:hypothetical protein
MLRCPLGRFRHCFANLNFDFFQGLMADLNKTYQSQMLLLTALVNCTMVADLIIEIKLWKPNPLNLLRGNVTQSLLLYFLQFLGADYMESFQPRLNFSPVNRAEITSRLHGQFEPGLSYINQGWKFQPGMKISTRDENFNQGWKFQPGMKCSLGWNFFHVIVKFILYWIYRDPGLKIHPGFPGWNFIPGWKPPCNRPLSVSYNLTCERERIVW